MSSVIDNEQQFIEEGNHQSTHIRGKHPCEIYGQQFAWKNNLSVHQKSAHKGGNINVSNVITRQL